MVVKAKPGPHPQTSLRHSSAKKQSAVAGHVAAPVAEPVHPATQRPSDGSGFSHYCPVMKKAKRAVAVHTLPPTPKAREPGVVMAPLLISARPPTKRVEKPSRAQLEISRKFAENLKETQARRNVRAVQEVMIRKAIKRGETKQGAVALLQDYLAYAVSDVPSAYHLAEKIERFKFAAPFRDYLPEGLRVELDETLSLLQAETGVRIKKNTYSAEDFARHTRVGEPPDKEG